MSNETTARGRFIVLEGISGSGKSTLRQKLAERLESLGIRVVTNAEPTSANIFGIAIRKTIEHRALSEKELDELRYGIVRLLRVVPISESAKEHVPHLREYFRTLSEIPEKFEHRALLTELERQFLFRADSVLDVTETILPALERGEWVLQDRFDLSSFAYGSADPQGLTIKGLYEWCVAVLGKYYLMPDMTFFVVCSAKTAAARLAHSGKPIDLYEKEAHLAKIAKQYEDAILFCTAVRKNTRIVRIDGERPIEDVVQSMVRALTRRALLPSPVRE